MTAAPLPHIGFIGLGAMGWPMAACLAKAGYALTVHDADATRAAAFAAEHGKTSTADIGDLAEKSNIVITMLPNSAIVESVLFGEAGMQPRLNRGTILLDMTSGIPSATVQFSKRLEADGVILLDAPVSGGVPRAVTGQLTIMTGGDSTHVEKALPVLQTMGSVIQAGPVGAGHAMKALNNLVNAGGFLIGIEALVVGSKFGIDPETMVDVLNASTGMNNSTQKKFKQFVLSRKFDSGFLLSLMVKDLSIALGLARDEEVNAPFSSLCRDLWASAGVMLGPKADHTEAALFCEQLTGYRIGDR